ncbi:nucleotide exchange factor GrpE [Nocardioides sp.]|uniref:nucleotide exchange factor GrpE n=1 Tax=Nocardioides sp. TaxID=35761 RepID=UPI00263915EB|nr:nucleotide exchange factor GrpE [Nocardioides sp.]MCW2738517.1 Protein GrpE [Nocardioides sp.]
MTESGSASFGDAAGEMANETEVEVPQEGASASAGQPDAASDTTSDTISDTTSHASSDTTTDPGAAGGTSGVDNWLEEGGPLEPEDFADDGDAVGPSAEVRLAERTADLQRLQAEYANYRKRVDRDRQLITENATYRVLSPIIEVLDTIDRAREHGEVDGGGFKAVADQLQSVVAGLGLTRFGEPGDAFDPNLHEALSHLGTDPEVDVITCKHIAKAGYKIGDRVVRAAQVLVVDPAED